ncbi:MAG: TIGR04282 family arsenosugar biosynthesis glycosyltransferase [Candidatus Omnitrophica bacterium]|nr:TIGR04282 family arsenosugar biosynthesis glycosyltransferase [Candidatus Omnitrophota bacterium]
MESLGIFLKFPQAGFVKTRLAKDIGKTNAAYFYKQISEFILKRIYKKKQQQIIFYTPANFRNEIINWLGKDYFYLPQQGLTLGDKMEAAFGEMFAKGAAKAIIVGTDCPQIDKMIIAEAFAKLKDYDCVLGPAKDGGYYLIGLKNNYKDLFSDIDWSTEKVLNQTKKKLETMELSCYLLQELVDIDDYQDLKKIDKECFQDLKLAKMLNNF